VTLELEALFSAYVEVLFEKLFLVLAVIELGGEKN
jgi:hypothetical protein